MTITSEPTLRDLEASLLEMPPVRALQVRLLDDEEGRLRIKAPLSANVNDKGSAFGGSLVSLMTLAAWALTTREVEAAGMQAEVFVADSEVRYLAPLHADLVAEAWLDDASSWPVFLRTLEARGRARATLQMRVLLPDGGVATSARARYVAIRKQG